MEVRVGGFHEKAFASKANGGLPVDRAPEKLTVEWRRLRVAAEGKDAVRAIATPVRTLIFAGALSLLVAQWGSSSTSLGRV